MDEWTNEVDFEQLDAIRCALQSTVPGIVEALQQVRSYALRGNFSKQLQKSRN